MRSCSRHAIPIVCDGENAGVISVAFFNEQLQGPLSLLYDRKAWSTISYDLLSYEILKNRFGLSYILPKLVRCLGRHHQVLISVRSDLMSSRGHGSYQVRMPFRYPTKYEKRSLDLSCP